MLHSHKMGQRSLCKQVMRELVDIARGTALSEKAEHRESSGTRGILIGQEPRPSSICECCLLMVQPLEGLSESNDGGQDS